MSLTRSQVNANNHGPAARHRDVLTPWSIAAAVLSNVSTESVSCPSIINICTKLHCRLPNLRQLQNKRVQHSSAAEGSMQLRLRSTSRAEASGCALSELKVTIYHSLEPSLP